MNDYWNDPPEEPEPPQCPRDDCDGYGELKHGHEDGMTLFCDTCGKEWDVDYPSEPDPPDWKCDECGEQYPCSCMEEDGPETDECPHGNPWEDCGACDHEGDIAFDAAREQRHFGR